jgi:hypothetical protein
MRWVTLLVLVSSRSKQLCKTEGCRAEDWRWYFKYNNVLRSSLALRFESIGKLIQLPLNRISDY